jgi:hypothetical protein
MSTGSLRKPYSEALHDMIEQWTADHPDEPIDHEAIAIKAIDEGAWRPQRRNLVKELTRHLAKVTGSKHETNEQGVSVKKYHAARVEVVVKGKKKKKKQKTLWADRKRMSADHAHMSFKQEWEQIAGHCKSLNTSQADWNQNNPNAKGHESQLQFDFTMIVNAPAEQQVAKIAPEAPNNLELKQKHPR